MSRLESLDRKNKPSAANPAAKPGLRFKPKVVARRSEQERKKDAPVIREENKKHHKKSHLKDKKNNNGKNGFRGQRGVKTETVMSGPLSSTAVSDMGRGGGGAGFGGLRSLSMSPTPEYFSKMKSRTREGTPRDDDEYEDNYGNDPTMIDLNKDIALNEDDEISSLFPIRPLQFANLDSSSESVAEKQDEPVKVKKEEDPEIDLDGDNTMKTINSSSEEAASVDAPLVENMKLLKLFDDHAQNGKFMLLQLPSQLPKFQINKKDESEAEPTAENDVLKNDVLNLEAKLRVHKSGKLSIRIGSVNFDVTSSASVGFLQDAVKMVHYKDDEDSDKYEFHQLGQVGKKIIAVPEIL